MPLPQITLLLLTLLGSVFFCTLSGCSEEPEFSVSAPKKPTIKLLPLVQIDAKLHPMQMGKPIKEALRALNKALDHPESLSEKLLQKHRWRLVQTTLEIAIHVRIKQTLTPKADKTLRDELREWEKLLEQSSSSLRAREGEDSMGRLARRLRGMVRSLLRSPEYAGEARGALVLLDLLDKRGGESAHLRAARRMRNHPQGLMGAYGHAILALDILREIKRIKAVPLGDQAPIFGEALGYFCREGVSESLRATSPRGAREHLRRSCGLACTPTTAPGYAAPNIPPISAETYQECGAEQMGLSTASKGHYLGFNNFLLARAMGEIQEIREVLSGVDISAPTQLILAPLIKHFSTETQALVMVGHLPFLAQRGPNNLKLPTLHQALHPLPPTPVVLVLQKNTLSLAAWPRFQFSPEGLLLGDDPFGYPGKTLGLAPKSRTGEVLAWSQDTEEALTHGLSEVTALPWPAEVDSSSKDPLSALQAGSSAHPAGGITAPPTPSVKNSITLVMDADADLRMLRPLAKMLRRAGFTQLQIAAWPAQDGLLRIPVATGVTVRIDRPEPFTSRLHVADHNTYLIKPRGDVEECIPIASVDRYLPDIYAATKHYAEDNPGLDDLIIDLEPSLSLQSAVKVFDALRFARTGNVMASTRRLLAANPAMVFGDGEILGPHFLHMAPSNNLPCVPPSNPAQPPTSPGPLGAPALVPKIY